ncbi:MAG: hypothetical protein GWN58_66995 [Anaerolineae bacterium]|nr:hypothetical protein [Anaerolineae bacterium]
MHPFQLEWRMPGGLPLEEIVGLGPVCDTPVVEQLYDQRRQVGKSGQFLFRHRWRNLPSFGL